MCSGNESSGCRAVTAASAAAASRLLAGWNPEAGPCKLASQPDLGALQTVLGGLTVNGSKTRSPKDEA